MDMLSFFLVQHGQLHAAEGGAGASYSDRVFAGLTDAQMRARPGGGVNSLVWLLWHMARTEDVAVNLVVADGRQVLDDEWARRMDVPWRAIGTVGYRPWQGHSRAAQLADSAIRHNALHLGEAVTVRSLGGFSLGV